MTTESTGNETYYEQFSERIRGGNLHRSPFEEFCAHEPDVSFYQFHNDLVYDGTVQTAIQELRQALVTPTEGKNYKALALRPPTLIRGIIDANLENPHGDVVTSVKNAVNIGLATYKGDYPTALSLLDGYEKGLTDSVRTSEIHQPDDIASWMGYDPSYSYRNAMDLAFRFGKKPLLIIGLGQGSTAAGLDVLLRNSDITQNPDSELYVVRYSRNKKKDDQPKITLGEKEYLQRSAEGKQVVLFEEDSVSARTLQLGTNFFRENIFPNQPVFPLTNYKGSSSAIVY